MAELERITCFNHRPSQDMETSDGQQYGCPLCLVGVILRSPEAPHEWYKGANGRSPVISKPGDSGLPFCTTCKREKMTSGGTITVGARTRSVFFFCECEKGRTHVIETYFRPADEREYDALMKQLRKTYGAKLEEILSDMQN